MNPFLMAGSAIVVVALVFYSIGVITEQRKRLVTNFVLTFISLGLFCDLTGTVCMIIGAQKIITLHGLIGYSALVGMLVDIVLLYRFKKSRLQTPSRALHLYTRIAYLWWVVAFVSGCALAMMH
jgi:uncharacterized repeat protein (TIGR03987 family)